MLVFGNGGGTSATMVLRWPWEKPWQTFERRSPRAKKKSFAVVASKRVSKLVTNFKTYLPHATKFMFTRMLFSLQCQAHFSRSLTGAFSKSTSLQARFQRRRVIYINFMVHIWVFLKTIDPPLRVCLRGMFRGYVSGYVSGICFGVCFVHVS